MIAVAGVITVVLQVLVVKLLPAFGTVTDVHDATGTLVVVIGGGHVVVVCELPLVGPDGLHEATGTLVVTIGDGQLVVIQLLPLVAVTGLQVATGTFNVCTGAGQVMVIQGVDVGTPDGVQLSTKLLAKLLPPPVLQAIVNQLLTPFPVCGVHV